MNKRIEKLAEQAGMIVDKYGLARDAENGLEDGVDIYKFAELIIRECARVASDYDGAHYVGDAIEQHFGVM